MNETAHSKPLSNRRRLEFCFTDLDLAEKFLHGARASRNPRAVQRNYEYARKVYEVLVDFVPRLNPPAADLQSLNEKLALLGAELRTFPFPWCSGGDLQPLDSQPV